MFSLLKNKIYAIGAGIIAVLLGIVKFLAHRNKSLKQEVKSAKSALKYREEVDSMDAEINQEFSHRAEEAQRDIQNDEIPRHLRHRR